MRVTIRRETLEAARIFFEDRGSLGLEGTAMLAGREGGGITRCVIPDQLGHRTSLGVAVEITPLGKQQLAGALSLAERWFARIHSHPDEAFHSSTDDKNPILTAEGSLSIVVPFFGLGLRHGLEACAVCVFLDGEWIPIAPEAHVDHLEVIE